VRRVFICAWLALGGCAGRPLDGAGDPVVGGGDDLGTPPTDLAAPADAGVDGGSDDGGGSGLFGPLRTLAMPSGWEPLSVIVADVTGDGRDDIVVGAGSTSPTSDDAVVVFAQRAGGTLAPPVVYPGGSVGAGMIAAADLDGDGRRDVVLLTYQDVRVLLQTFAGTLGAPRILTPSRPDETELLVTGDFDGDGRADVLTAGWAAPGVDVWYQADGLAAPHNFACPHGGYDAIAVADLDGDGALDIALSSGESSTLSVLMQRSGSFAPATTVPLSEHPPPEDLAAADVDGDGRPDLIFVSGLHTAGQYLDVLHGNGDGTFALARTFDTDYWPNGVLVADVDGDQRSDVIVPHFSMLRVGIYRQLGTSASGLAAEEEYPYATSELDRSGLQRTAVGDVNGDGKPDIVDIATDVFILYHR
jgi:hypothetical protein